MLWRLAIILPLLAGCGSPIASVIAQTNGSGTLTVTWTAPTQNTDGSPIEGTLTFTVYEVNSSSSILATAASAVVGESVGISNVSSGPHCYAVQTVETFANGATTSSALSAIACTTVQVVPSPNAPTNVKATGS